MGIIHIYGARAIFLLFYDNQDTESESQETEIGIYGTILTQKNQSLYGITIPIPHNMGEKYSGNCLY